MCLSNVYKKEVSDSNLMFRNIADIGFDGGELTLTDIMGIRRSIKASVKKIDLLENYIIVDPEE
ncbi:MAG: CooT family nickel-binding protein [Eubacterium sp.]|nr:CooT family nickel-binding protein [Eubacterium sp.]